MIILLNILLLVIGFLFAGKSARRYSSYVNHLNIFSYVWAIVTVGTQFAYPDKIEISTVILYYICWYFYIFGSSLIKHKEYQSEPTFNLFTRFYFLIIFLLICAVISNLELLSMITRLGDLQAWANLRKEQAFDELESSIFNTIFQRGYLIYIPIAIYLKKNNKISWIFVILLILSGVIISLLRFTRAPLFQLLIIMLVSYVYFYKKKLPIFLIVSGVILLFTVFGVSMFFLAGGSSRFSVLDDIKLYLFSGQVAFQDFLNDDYIDNVKYDMKYFSLDFLNYILKKIGLIETYPSYVRDYSRVVLTNTYTYLDAFTYDFGVIGAAIGSLIIGFLSDLSYDVFYKRKNVFALIFYGYICYYNAFIFANNEFIRFSVLLTLVSLAIYSFIIKKRKLA